jgi:hypothetical protein
MIVLGPPELQYSFSQIHSLQDWTMIKMNMSSACQLENWSENWKGNDSYHTFIISKSKTIYTFHILEGSLQSLDVPGVEEICTEDLPNRCHPGPVRSVLIDLIPFTILCRSCSLVLQDHLAKGILLYTIIRWFINFSMTLLMKCILWLLMDLIERASHQNESSNTDTLTCIELHSSSILWP